MSLIFLLEELNFKKYCGSTPALPWWRNCRVIANSNYWNPWTSAGARRGRARQRRAARARRSGSGSRVGQHRTGETSAFFVPWSVSVCSRGPERLRLQPEMNSVPARSERALCCLCCPSHSPSGQRTSPSAPPPSRSLPVAARKQVSFHFFHLIFLFYSFYYFIFIILIHSLFC